MHPRITKPDLEKFIDDKVKAGDFDSSGAVVDDALQRMVHQDYSLIPQDIPRHRPSRRANGSRGAIYFNSFATAKVESAVFVLNESRKALSGTRPNQQTVGRFVSCGALTTSNGEEGTRLELFLAGIADNADVLAAWPNV
jgi:Arc/MetJ-type ribon-helix-helix transcriptional regulator